MIAGRALILALLVALASGAAAEEFRLKDGTVLRGAVTEVEPGRVLITPRDGKGRWVNLDDIVYRGPDAEKDLAQPPIDVLSTNLLRRATFRLARKYDSFAAQKIWRNLDARETLMRDLDARPSIGLELELGALERQSSESLVAAYVKAANKRLTHHTKMIYERALAQKFINRRQSKKKNLNELNEVIATYVSDTPKYREPKRHKTAVDMLAEIRWVRNETSLLETWGDRKRLSEEVVEDEARRKDFYLAQASTVWKAPPLTGGIVQTQVKGWQSTIFLSAKGANLLAKSVQEIRRRALVDLVANKAVLYDEGKLGGPIKFATFIGRMRHIAHRWRFVVAKRPDVVLADFYLLRLDGDPYYAVLQLADARIISVVNLPK